MTGGTIDATNSEFLAVPVEANSGKDTTEGAKISKINESINNTEIDLEEEWNTEKYKVTLNIDIKNIVKIENIHNNHKIYWRTIYEVVQL